MFPGTVIPRDFDTIEIPFAERGEPTLDPLGCRAAQPLRRPREAQQAAARRAE